MHIAPPRQFDLAPLEALRVSMRRWLMLIAAWLIEHCEPALTAPHTPAFLREAYAAACRELDAELRLTAREFRALLVAHAYTRMGLPAASARLRTRRPPALRHRADRNSLWRKFTAIPALKRLHAGSFSERAARLTHMLDHMEPLIADVLAQMLRMWKRPRVTIAHPAPAHAVIPANRAPLPPAHADTS